MQLINGSDSNSSWRYQNGVDVGYLLRSGDLFMARLGKIRMVIRQDLSTEEWYHIIRWQVAAGAVDLWGRRGLLSGDPVRVTGEVPEASFALAVFGPAGWSQGWRTDAEVALVEGLAAEVEGHRVVFRMPERGWRRDRRRVFIEIDDAAYVARPRSLGVSDLRRSDGERVWRKGFMSEWLAADATPVEVTVAALCSVTRLHERMVRNFIRFI
ncbi:MAG: hypothetical protein ABI239_10025 [Aquihabitans sp.]